MNNPKVNIKDIKNLSKDWYKLDKVNFDYQLKNGTWQNQNRECYDRGNGACILLYNTKKQTIILTKQFRMPSYLNGNKDGMMIEVCAGLLDENDPITCVIHEAEEETEEIEVLELDFNKALTMITANEINDAKTVILLQYAKINHLL